MEIDQKVGWELLEHLKHHTELLLVVGSHEAPVAHLARAVAAASLDVYNLDEMMGIMHCPSWEAIQRIWHLCVRDSRSIVVYTHTNSAQAMMLNCTAHASIVVEVEGYSMTLKKFSNDGKKIVFQSASEVRLYLKTRQIVLPKGTTIRFGSSPFGGAGKYVVTFPGKPGESVVSVSGSKQDRGFGGAYAEERKRVYDILKSTNAFTT